MGGNGKAAGRACPAPTGCRKWVADERGKGGRQPAPSQWAGVARRNFNEDFEIEQAGPEDVGCDLLDRKSVV